MCEGVPHPRQTYGVRRLLHLISTADLYFARPLNGAPEEERRDILDRQLSTHIVARSQNAGSALIESLPRWGYTSMVADPLSRDNEETRPGS
jgi:hypothetical protein